MDGTLTDSASGIVASLRHAMAAVGVGSLDAATERAFIGPPMIASMRRLVPPDRVDDAVAAYREYFVARGMFDNAVYDGVPDVLRRLTAAGVRLAVATSKTEIYAVQILEHFGLADLFEVVGGATMDGSRITKPDVLASVLDRLEHPDPATAVMFGDRHHDVEGAAAHGIDCYAVEWGYGAPGEHSNAAGRLVRPEQMADIVLVRGSD